jgi:hypothetical protein
LFGPRSHQLKPVPAAFGSEDLRGCVGRPKWAKKWLTCAIKLDNARYLLRHLLPHLTDERLCTGWPRLQCVRRAWPVHPACPRLDRSPAAKLPHSAQGRNIELPIKALDLLAAPSTPAETRDEALDRAENGEKLTLADVKKMRAPNEEIAITLIAVGT